MSEMSIKDVTEESKAEETSEFLKTDVLPFCEYMNGENIDDTKKGIIVIAVDGDCNDGHEHMSLFVKGNQEHIAQAIGRIMDSPNGGVLRRGIIWFNELLRRKVRNL